MIYQAADLCSMCLAYAMDTHCTVFGSLQHALQGVDLTREPAPQRDDFHIRRNMHCQRLYLPAGHSHSNAQAMSWYTMRSNLPKIPPSQFSRGWFLQTMQRCYYLSAI